MFEELKDSGIIKRFGVWDPAYPSVEIVIPQLPSPGRELSNLLGSYGLTRLFGQPADGMDSNGRSGFLLRHHCTHHSTSPIQKVYIDDWRWRQGPFRRGFRRATAHDMDRSPNCWFKADFTVCSVIPDPASSRLQISSQYMEVNTFTLI